MSPLFFFNDTATTEIYTLSLHDALPICRSTGEESLTAAPSPVRRPRTRTWVAVDLASRNHLPDRKSTRLNSSHSQISYAVFCLKKKNTWAGRRFPGRSQCLKLPVAPPLA